MNIIREEFKVIPQRWNRYRYNITSGIGDNGRRITGCAEHIAISRKIATEGMVLLENNGLLPLKDDTTVALFGVGTIEYISGGGGSGLVFPEYCRNVYEGFAEKEPRIHVYEPLSKFYYDHVASLLNTVPYYQILEESDIPSDLFLDAAAKADVAIIVIHRYSGEGCDRSSEKGDFYLTDKEQALVDRVTSSFPHSVAVLNVGGMIDTSWIRQNPKIDGALLAWQAGMEGANAIADIICGDINPSGKLVDTFAKSFNDYPSADTFNESDDYVEYYEDIYVGYRYFETIPGAFEKVMYPFGYGLSYTSFAFSKPVADAKEDKIEVFVTVTNTGSVSGKEVVQVYFSAPQGVLGKSKISLAGFRKTKLLAPGEKQTIHISFPIADMASYDDLGKLCKSAYVLEQGQYSFFAGNSCRNLQECEYKYIVPVEFVVTQQLQTRCAPNILRKRMLSDGSFEEIPAFPLTHYTAQNVEPAACRPEKTHQFIDVADGKITLDEFVAQMTDNELIEMCCGVPNRGIANTSGWGGLVRLGVPAVMTVDGPAGVHLSTETGIATTSWPCATLLACTWDPNLAYAMGTAGGLECKENGLATWLTPGLNIHRNPLCGRNFEYYSEDPLITGRFAAAMVSGIQSSNTAASPKHFAANNKETKRYYSDSRMSERALREIYLKGFEICVKTAQPWTIMTSYNILNARRTCECFELIDGILRQEWGFEGMVITDWHGPCNHEHCIVAGINVRMPRGYPDQLTEALNHRRVRRGNLEVSVKHVLKMILKLD